jgi:hypothetical protein
MSKALMIAGLMILTCAGSAAQAGLYTDDMSRCLVEATSREDKATLVRWIFIALSQNPAISSLSKVTGADIDKANEAVGALFMKLLTDSCADKTKKAISYEGEAAIQTSFAVLGQVAAAELFSDPKARAVMAGLDKYADKKKLDALKSNSPVTPSQ